MKGDRRTREPGLTPELLLKAYGAGFFPMADSREGPIHWYSPEPRGIIPLESFHVPRALRRVMRSARYAVRCDTVFERVMRECASREETWISEDIICVYTELHRMGHAHSVEAWEQDTLAGGLYGVVLGAAFFGESMFSLRPDASKVALVSLVDRLRAGGFALLDTQFVTAHLRMFGAREISRREYLDLLVRAVRGTGRWL